MRVASRARRELSTNQVWVRTISFPCPTSSPGFSFCGEPWRRWGQVGSGRAQSRHLAQLRSFKWTQNEMCRMSPPRARNEINNLASSPASRASRDARSWGMQSSVDSSRIGAARRSASPLRLCAAACVRRCTPRSTHPLMIGIDTVAERVLLPISLSAPRCGEYVFRRIHSAVSTRIHVFMYSEFVFIHVE